MTGNYEYHFALQGNNVVCWNGHDGWTVIAKVIEERPCRHLLRHAQFTEDTERLLDKFIMETAGYCKEAPCPEVLVKRQEEKNE